VIGDSPVMLESPMIFTIRLIVDFQNGDSVIEITEKIND